MPPRDPKVLLDAFKLKPAEAIKYFRAKGYRFSWNWYDTWKDEHNKAFTVAKVTQMDVLQDIRGMVDKALDEGITLQQFKKELIPRLKEKGWWGRAVDPDTKKEVQLGSPRRLRTIYQTNLQTSYMAGRYKGLMDAVATQPYWQYVAVLDSRTRPSHRALNGLVFRYDDPFWKTHYVPNGWGCRCRVRSLTERGMAREGLKVSSAKMEQKAVNIGGKQVSVTGARVIGANGNPVTVWADPGWDYNPGMSSWKPDLRKYNKDLVEEYKKVVPAEPKTRFGNSKFIPTGFDKYIGNDTLPDTFWDKLGHTVPLRVVKQQKSYYQPGMDFVQLGLTRPGIDHKNNLKFVAAHEYGHALFEKSFKSDKFLEKMQQAFAVAQAEFVSMSDTMKANFLKKNYVQHKADTYKGRTSIPYIEHREQYLAATDVVMAITGGKHGTGHTVKYFANGKNRYHEFFAHATELYFRGNPMMEKFLPKTADAMKKLWEWILITVYAAYLKSASSIPSPSVKMILRPLALRKISSMPESPNAIK